MFQSEIVNKLALELALANGDLDHLKNNRIYIQMALSIGLEHFDKREIEIVALWRDGGGEAGRFKSVPEASTKLGIPKGNINHVLMGRRVSAGGLTFMKSMDYDLLPREQKSPSISQNEL